MALTPKQERNGIPAMAAGQATEIVDKGPMPDVPPLVAQAMSAAIGTMTEGHAMMGALAGHAVSFEWDAGLAVNDVEGGGSG